MCRSEWSESRSSSPTVIFASLTASARARSAAAGQAEADTGRGADGGDRDEPGLEDTGRWRSRKVERFAGDRQECARLDPRHRPGGRDDQAGRATRAVSSRLVRSPLGRPVAVEVTTPDVGLEVGYRFAVLGTEISMTSGRVQWTGTPTGRPPLVEEATAPRRRGGSHRQMGQVPGQVS